MELDDEVCLCFHVSKRKVLSFLRHERPKRPGQLSECFGAGTGCGWCRAYLTRLFEAFAAAQEIPDNEPSAREYSKGRSGYIRQGGGTPPPGATPIDEELEESS